MPLGNERTTDAATDNRHPLNEFWGDIADITDPSRPSRTDASKSNTFIVFDINNLDVIEAREPYNFPVTKVEIMELTFANTPWEAFKESLRKCGFEGSLNNLIGKRTHWKYAPAILNRSEVVDGKRVYSNVEGACWQIVEIEGVNNTSDRLMDAVVALADGKNETDFKTQFLANNELRTMTNYASMMQMVIGNSALSTLVSAGKLTFDGTTYHKI